MESWTTRKAEDSPRPAPGSDATYAEQGDEARKREREEEGDEDERPMKYMFACGKGDRQ